MPAYDWSAPRLLPIEITVHDGGLELRAGGESLSFTGPLFSIQADRPLRAEQTLANGEFATLSLSLEAEEDTRLERVTWLPGNWNPTCEREVLSTNLQDIALFLRRGGVSFFLSLDFPYSETSSDGIAYPPHQVIPGGTTYGCHTLSIGACRLSGVGVGGLDRAEVEALSTYVERRYPQRFERPVTIGVGIGNRMTYVREGRIFYSMINNPTLYLDPDLLEEDMRLYADVGVEYYQVFEGVFDWPDQEKTGAAYRRLMQVAHSLGVRVGGYVDPCGGHCPHFNYEHRRIERPEWALQVADGQLGAFCLAGREWVELLTTTLVEHGRRYGEELICLDFLNVQPCYSPHHGHPPGDVYQQVFNLVRFMQALANISPEYLVWSNSGNWLELMPKLVWYNPNVYLTDPHVRQYEPTLNALKLFGDFRREQMVSVHERYAVPYRAFTNCEYYAFPRSRVHDLRTFEYSFLQGLAVTPNICPGELRNFLDRIPSKRRQACMAFMRRWLRFMREHYDVWKQTARISDPPAVGSTEIYAHIAGDHGYVCLINQNPYPRTARFRLDSSVGLSGAERFLVRGIYPRECPIAEQSLPGAAYGEEIVYRLPAHSVRYLEVQPLEAAPGVQVYGLPARVEAMAGGYRIFLRAPQGETISLGLVLPEGEVVASVSAQQVPTVPMYTFPTSARITAQAGQLARLEITFPRDRAPRELTRWHVTPGDVLVELPQAEHCPFLGALVHGAFSEEYEVELLVTVAPGPGVATVLPASEPPLGSQTIVPTAPRQTFSTTFELPFIEPLKWGCEPGYDDDTVIELAFTDPARVQSISARLNGQPVSVQRYAYPKVQWHTFYLELTRVVDPGTIQLELDIEWRP